MNKTKNKQLKYFPLILLLFFGACSDDKTYVVDSPDLDSTEELIETTPVELYNIFVEDYLVVKEIIKKNQALSDILYPNHISYQRIQEVADQSKDIFSVRKLRAGNRYTLFLNKDSINSLAYMVYEIDQIDYLVFDFTDSVNVFRDQLPVTIVQKTASGVIETSLWNTMKDNNLDQELILSLADVYAWTIDFYHLQKGDSFKVIYRERQVDGKFVGTDYIIAAEFTHFEAPLRAYLFVSDGIDDYFDDEGKNLRKAFLRAPVKFSRISSRYSKKRFHPVQKRFKSHLGTDYAARTGTPILATGDGVIVASTYAKYNGNYVKIKHNATYTTQYLHMSKRAVKVGDSVKQGDVIGYVGSTGLASGPHVCYRFWKNGKQVNPYKQKLPDSKPVKADEMESFIHLKDSLLLRLNNIPIQVSLPVEFVELNSK